MIFAHIYFLCHRSSKGRTGAVRVRVSVLRTGEQERDVGDADSVEEKSDFQNVIGSGQREEEDGARHRH